MTMSKKQAGLAAGVVLAGALLGYLSRPEEESVPKKAGPSYNHPSADHVAPISSQQTGRCYDVFPSDSELPPREAAHFPAWHKEHYGTDAKDVRFSSGVNWRLLCQRDGDGVYVSYGSCNGHRFERVAYRGKTALAVDGVAPIESRLDDILKSMR